MFNERLKNARLEKKMTQVELAKRIGITKALYNKYERTQTRPPYETLNAIADELNVSVDYLTGKTAFKNSYALFEHWGVSLDGTFEAAFDFGGLLKEEREKQGISIKEVSEALDLTESDIEGIEDGLLPLNYEWAEKYANFLGTNTSQIFFNNNMYDDEVPEDYHNDIANYEKLNKRIDDEALNDPDYEKHKKAVSDDIITIAAHHDGEEWTEEELEELENFKEYIKSKRKK